MSEDEGETKEFTLHSEDDQAFDSDRYGIDNLDGRAYRSVEHDRNQDNSSNNLSRAHSLKFNPTFDIVLPQRVVEDAGETGIKFFEDAKEPSLQEPFRLEFSIDQMKPAEIDPDDSDFDIQDEDEMFDKGQLLRDTSEPTNSAQKNILQNESSSPKGGMLVMKNNSSEKKIKPDLAQFDSLNTPKPIKETTQKDQEIFVTNPSLDNKLELIDSKANQNIRRSQILLFERK